MNQVGRYQILEELGRGAWGVVYRALDPAIGRTVAIKSIRFSEFSDPVERRDLRERILREAQSAGKLSHPNIVTIYDVLETDDLAYIFMEFVDGLSLKDAMRQDKLPAREQLLSILRQLAEALDYAHRKGIIHRDIKPANIMISDRGVDKDGVAKIADFGVAKLISHESTHQRALMGTPAYMSPEQLEGVSVGGASDQFALGVVVYELLTGEKPFAADNLAALHYMICKRPAKPVNELNPVLSEGVNRVMERALAKLPEERFSSCSEFLGALTVALGECPEWRPIMPRQIEDEAAKPVGKGWYAPETVVSSRLIEAQTATHSLVIDPDVLPPEPPSPAEATAISRRLATAEERAEFANGQVRPLEPRSSGMGGGGTKIRVTLEPKKTGTWGILAAACAAIVLLGLILLRTLSSPRTNTPQGETSRVISSTPPEDLSTSDNRTTASSGGGAQRPAVAKPIAASSPGTTTLTVHTPPVPVPARTPAPTPATAAAPRPVLHPTVLPAVKQPLRTHVAVPVVAAPPTDVELVSDPPGARVEVDNRSDLACLAPCSVPLGPGRHTLFSELAGYGTAHKIFMVPVDGAVFVSMNRNMGTILLTSDPSGADVAIDGRDYGPTPVRVHLSSGRHHLVISDGNRQHDETIYIDTDGVYARSIRW